MNILQILPELKSGGVERGTVDLAKYLKQKGHKAVVVSAGGSMVGDLVSAGVTHYALPVHKKSPLAVVRSVRALTKIVREEQIDVIHARSRVPALIAWWVSRRTEVPFVTTCHGFYSRHGLSTVMGWGKIVIVASRIIGKRMRDDFGVSHRKIRLIARGVNLEEFHWSRDSAPKKEIVTPPSVWSPSGDRSPGATAQTGGGVIGVIGRLTPIKGHPLFLKAMARVLRVFPEAKFRIIGDAPKPQYKEELMALSRQLGISKSVEFLGTRYDIPKLLSEMTVLVVPSVGEEAFGRVVIEAGACGVPVVATRMGGLVDILEDGQDGLLVSSDDPREMADAVIKLLRDAALCDRLARTLRKKVERDYPLPLMFEKTLEVYRLAAEPQKILVIKLSAVGDVILSIPSIRLLRHRYPRARISVLVGKKARKIIRNCPYVDDVMTHERQPGIGRIHSFFRTGKILAHEDFDIVVDFQNNRESHLLSYLSGARTRAGHGNGKWSFFLNHRAKAEAAVSAPLEHQFQVLKALGLEGFEKRLELWADEEEERAVGRFLESHWIAPRQTLVGINPGSSPRWPTKRWAVENFAKLCDELGRRNIRVVLTGSKDDEPLAEALMNLTRNKPVNAVGKTTLTELVALIRRCQAFVSSDSAPMHIAASVDVPLVALFGPTDPKRHLVAPSAYRVFWREISCSPCYLRDCPVGHLCMKGISVHEVLDAVLALLKDRRAAFKEMPASPAGLVT